MSTEKLKGQKGGISSSMETAGLELYTFINFYKWGRFPNAKMGTFPKYYSF